MKLTFILSNYPSISRPFNGIFIQELIRAFAKKKVKCAVIRPQSIFEKRFGILDPIIRYDKSVSNNAIKIYSPRYLSLSNKNLGLFNTYSITHYNFYEAVRKTLVRNLPLPDFLYGHFFYSPGAVVATLNYRMNIPSFIGVGESELPEYFNFIRLSKWQRDSSAVNGILSVSEANKKFCIDVLGIPSHKIKVLPNGIDLSVFYPRNKIQMRKQFGFPINKFIIAFTGQFIERKGPDRLLSAASGLKDVGLIFIGSGPIPLEHKNILFQGFLNHSQIPEMLSAADIFVLPTLSEGSCNAIIEALACGLPVVTSNGAFNDEIIDNQVAIRVNPTDITDIRKAILKLLINEDLRKQMSTNAIKKAKNYDINLRVVKMLNWMQENKFNR